MDVTKIVKRLGKAGIKFTSGLNESEITDAESLYNIKFPPDLKSFLMYALPVSEGFVNWRDISGKNVKSINDRINWPLKGIIFDIEHNHFWIKEWGNIPDSLQGAIKIATLHYHKAPKLIPVYSHRYISSEPIENWNPIMSVYQTDIIYYGENLSSYLQKEFILKKPKHLDFNNIKPIRFWSNIIDNWDEEL
ncbi:SMI1/KNR4 family protein [Bacillus sp. SM2101]|uniref:SMI1/KNR4 family protein n=1 Tax=Bacillus sp. SM2101 TaxID=2805366 RepID=UPI001BDE7D1B|nr:SMI1/KNR4 family protein [Bacillus sp. SM2101]